MIAYLGYRIAVNQNDLPPVATVLVYKNDLAVGSVVQARSLIPVEKTLVGEITDFIFPQDRAKLKDIPLIRGVKAGDLVRRGDFLEFSEGDRVLSGKYRSLWIPQREVQQAFQEGSRLELYGSNGRKVANDSILMKKEDAAILVALPLAVVPKVIQALEQGGVFVALKHHGETSSGARAPLSRITHGASLIF